MHLPPRNPPAAQHRCHASFRRAIPAASDLGHHLRALALGEDIHKPGYLRRSMPGLAAWLAKHTCKVANAWLLMRNAAFFFRRVSAEQLLTNRQLTSSP